MKEERASALRVLPRGRRGFLLVVAVLLFVGFLPSGFFAISPGPLFSLSTMVEVTGRPDPETPFHMVTVTAEESNWFLTLWAAANPRVAVWSEEVVTGGRSILQYREDMGLLMEQSRVLAARLAFKYAGMPATDEATSLVSIENGEVIGPSASLAFALQLSSILMEEDLARGLLVAATGVLCESGEILPVGGIHQKTVSCREGGIGLFIVPKANLEEALAHAGDMRVIGVDTFTEAIQAVREAARSIP